jgi:3',5'-cyclic-AMP phosphodiesterase
MTRRTFLLMSSSLAITGCNFEYSPYGVSPTISNLNAQNILRIISKEKEGTPNFKIALLSDTHTYYQDFEDVINHLTNRDDFDFILHGGDLTDSGIQKEYEWGESILAKSHLPYVTIIGNHDAMANGRAMYSKMFGYYNFHFDYNNTLFIGFNNNNWEYGEDVPDFVWLEETLAKYPLDQKKIVACHIPPFDSKRFNQTIQDQFHTLMQRYGVISVLSGHIHSHATLTKDAIEYIVIGSVSERSYISLEMTNSSISMKKIDV